MRQHMVQTSFSLAKYSFRSRGRETRRISPQSTSARRFMLAFPRLTASSAMTSSIVSGLSAIISSACMRAIVLLIPQAPPICPQDSTNRPFADFSSAPIRFSPP